MAAGALTTWATFVAGALTGPIALTPGESDQVAAFPVAEGTLGERAERSGLDQGLLALVLTAFLFSAFAMDWAGMHAVFGGFHHYVGRKSTNPPRSSRDAPPPTNSLTMCSLVSLRRR